MDQIEASGGTEAILELINLVRLDSRLWDRNSSNFITHYDSKLEHFSTIANQLNLAGGISVNGEMVASAWRELSEKYRRRLYDGKRRNGTTSWPFFEPMSFLRDQYEQARWHRSTVSNRGTQSPQPANVAQLVNTILNAHAVAEAEAAALAYTEQAFEQGLNDEDIKRTTSPKNKHDTNSSICNGVNGIVEKVIQSQQQLNEKQQLVDAAFRLFSAQQQSRNAATKCNNVESVTPSTSCPDTLIDVESTSDQAEQPQQQSDRQRATSSTPPTNIAPVPDACSLVLSSNVGTVAQNGRRKGRNRFSAYNRSKHSHKQVAAVTAAVGSTAYGCELSPQYASVANLNESQGEDTKIMSCHTNVADLITINNLPIPQPQHVDSAAKWENVGRVWIDMMKTVRSPQLALAAHKFVTNTLFAVLEADHQLLGADPTTTRVRIREDAPQIEVTMQH